MKRKFMKKTLVVSIISLLLITSLTSVSSIKTNKKESLINVTNTFGTEMKREFKIISPQNGDDITLPLTIEFEYTWPFDMIEFGFYFDDDDPDLIPSHQYNNYKYIRNDGANKYVFNGSSYKSGLLGIYARGLYRLEDGSYVSWGGCSDRVVVGSSSWIGIFSRSKPSGRKNSDHRRSSFHSSH